MMTLLRLFSVAVITYLMLIVTGCVIAAPASALIGSVPADAEPPAAWNDMPLISPVIIHRVANSEIICTFLTGQKDARACAIPSEATKDGACHIYVPSNGRYAGVRWAAVILRHEMAHCKGWDH